MRIKSVAILGRQPAIGRAELESVLGAENITPIANGEFAVGSELASSEIPFAQLGGSTRLGVIVGEIENGKWPEIVRKTAKYLQPIIDTLPKEGKIKLGISAYGIAPTNQDLLWAGLEFKKTIKRLGRTARVVPNTAPALNAAQVIHNQLTGDVGIELLLVASGGKLLLARTLKIQDIEAYTHRDQARPKRDSFVGMLPPKLAQIIVNLAVGQTTASSASVLDPFCGTGVILQEALLMGHSVVGTDINERMIDFTSKNLEWLATYGASHNVKVSDNISLTVGDATSHTWQTPISAVASETYLGQPLSSWPTHDKLSTIIKTCDTIIRKFLINLQPQLLDNARLCIAVPAWRSPTGEIHHLPLLDQLEVIGYNRVSFSWASRQDMVYHRPDQLVARELLVITRK